MSGCAEIDWTDEARVRELRRRAWREQGIVLIRIDREANPILRRLAEDRGFAEFGERRAAARTRAAAR